MSDWLFWCALSFLLGTGIGGLLVNELAWRHSRRDWAQLRRQYDEYERHWDTEIVTLKQEWQDR